MAIQNSLRIAAIAAVLSSCAVPLEGQDQQPALRAQFETSLAIAGVSAMPPDDWAVADVGVRTSDFSSFQLTHSRTNVLVSGCASTPVGGPACSSEVPEWARPVSLKADQSSGKVLLWCTREDDGCSDVDLEQLASIWSESLS